MDNNLLQIKFKQRLNKLASLDYDNFECWQIVEAFNKAQLEWVRRQVTGMNLRRSGDGATTMSIDDLQVLVTDIKLKGSNLKSYYETDKLPGNYLYFKRLTALGNTDCCKDRSMVVYLADAGDVNNILWDQFTRPSFEWGETFATAGNNRLRIYHNDEFTLERPVLTYYRLPRPIALEGCVDIATGNASPNVTCEFKDDIVEVLIDEAVAILAGDIENTLQIQRSSENAKTNS